jgi:hypothetical protein
MKAQLHSLALRRERLRAEIEGQRSGLRVALATIRQDLALASLGLLAWRLLARRPLLRTLAGLVLAAGGLLAARRKSRAEDAD